MEICLTEIDRCQQLSPRPNFIVLLGDRYGWQPVPNKNPTTEMEELRPHFADEEKKLILDWYREDTNAITPEYVLQPRGEAHRDYEHWQPVEDSLRATLRQAVTQSHLLLSADNRSTFKQTYAINIAWKRSMPVPYLPQHKSICGIWR